MQVVVKPSSTTTKIRVVFDASSKSTSGISLNNILKVGPTIYPQISNLLLQFSTYPVALTADISKMFRAVSLHPEDQDLHIFVWRPSLNTSCKTFG